MFKRFVIENKVKKTTPNLNMAKTLIDDSRTRFEYYYRQKDDISSSKFVFENLYESIREMSDAILELEGYKSYSHEANIAFLEENKILDRNLSNTLDKMRKLRNSSKYYGEKISSEKLKEQMPNFLKIKEILQKDIEKRMNK